MAPYVISATLKKLGTAAPQLVTPITPTVAQRIRVTDTLGPGESLPPNTRLKSQNKQAYLVLQNDRNVVLYQTSDGHPLWSTHTNWDVSPDQPFRGAFTMQEDGNAVLVDANGNAIWATATQGNPGSRLVVQDDGNMVIYGPDGRTVWQSETYGFVDHHENHNVFSEVASIADGAVDVLHKIPGVDWAGDRLKDFANTTAGKWILRGMAATMFPLIGPGAATLLGSALSVAAFSMPGLLRGEPIDRALVEEAKAAIDRVAGSSGKAASDVASELGPAIGNAADYVQRWADENNIDLDKLANEAQNVRDSVARKLDIRQVATASGLSDDLAQVVVDAATRTHNPDGHVFNDNGDMLYLISKPNYSAFDAMNPTQGISPSDLEAMVWGTSHPAVQSNVSNGRIALPAATNSKAKGWQSVEKSIGVKTVKPSGSAVLVGVGIAAALLLLLRR